MVNSRSLQDRARRSAAGEAYDPVAKGPGFRIGVGARRPSGHQPVIFVEVVLNPFPDRPRVRPEQLREEGDHVAWLEARGYGIACDDDGTITCERAVSPAQAEREVAAVRKRLGP